MTTPHNFRVLMAVFGGSIEEQLDWTRAYIDDAGKLGMGIHVPQVEDHETVVERASDYWWGQGPYKGSNDDLMCGLIEHRDAKGWK